MRRSGAFCIALDRAPALVQDAGGGKTRYLLFRAAKPLSAVDYNSASMLELLLEHIPGKPCDVELMIGKVTGAIPGKGKGLSYQAGYEHHFELCLFWQEYHQQGDMEKELGFSVSALTDRDKSMGPTQVQQMPCSIYCSLIAAFLQLCADIQNMGCCAGKIFRGSGHSNVSGAVHRVS